MDRIEQGLSSTTTFTFEADGVAVDPDDDAARVEVTDVFREIIVAETLAQAEEETGVFSHKLSPENTARLGPLELGWTATLDGDEQTFRSALDVAGGFYFTIGEILRDPQYGQDLSDFDAVDIAKKRQTAEDTIERNVHFAGVPRAKVVPLSGRDREELILPLRYVRGISAGSIAGEPIDLVETPVELDGPGVYLGSSSWPRGRQNVRLLVEYGLDEPPARLRDAAMLLTYHLLIDGPIDDRQLETRTEGGDIIRMSQPGRRGAITGIPEVDAAIIQEDLGPVSWIGF